MATVSSARPGEQFARVVRSLCVARGDPIVAHGYLQAQGHAVEALAVEKGLITPLDSGEFSNGLGSISFDLAQYLRPRTLVGRLPFLPAPSRVRTLLETAPLVASWVGEGAPIPFRASALSSGDILEPRKVGAGTILTKELVEHGLSGSVDLLLADATGGIRQKLDETLTNPDNSGSSTTPAAITSTAAGATHIASAGATVAAIDADLQRAVDALVATGCTLETARWVCHPKLATRLASLRGTGGAPAYPLLSATGGRLLGIEVVTSGACIATSSPTEYTLTLVECSEILLADEGAARLSVSKNAAVQMDDAPSAGAQSLVSLFQAGLVGLIVERVVSWKPRRAGVVATIVGINL